MSYELLNELVPILYSSGNNYFNEQKYFKMPDMTVVNNQLAIVRYM